MFHATKTLFMKNKLICIGATTFGAAAYFNDPIKSTMSYTNNRISYAAWSVAEKVAVKMPFELQDISTIFAKCESKMVADSLDAGAVVLGLPLPGLVGKIGSKQLDDEGAQLPRIRN